MKQEEINKIFQPVADDELAQALPGVPIVKYEDLEKFKSIEFCYLMKDRPQ